MDKSLDSLNCRTQVDRSGQERRGRQDETTMPRRSKTLRRLQASSSEPTGVSSPAPKLVGSAEHVGRETRECTGSLATQTPTPASGLAMNFSRELVPEALLL